MERQEGGDQDAAAGQEQRGRRARVAGRLQADHALHERRQTGRQEGAGARQLYRQQGRRQRAAARRDLLPDRQPDVQERRPERRGARLDAHDQLPVRLPAIAGPLQISAQVGRVFQLNPPPSQLGL